MNYQRLIKSGIKRLREKNNLTPEVFAEKVGLTAQGLSNLERNKYQPTAETIDTICKAFKIHPLDLLTDYPEDIEKDEQLTQITAILKTYSKDELNKLYKILKVLKD